MKPWSRREVLAYLDNVTGATGELDHFSLLDVAVDADDDSIQRAFHRVAGGIHPDRHRNHLNAEQRERLTVVYARIAEAYRVLRDPEARENYLRKMGRDQGKSKAAEAPKAKSEISVLSPKAQRLFRRAKTALRTGDRTSAVLNLKMALNLHPDSELLRETLAAIKK